MTTTNQQGIVSAAAQKRQVAKTKKEPHTIKDYVSAYQGEVAKALPAVITPERFTRMVTTAITNTPKLADCTPQSFIGAMLNAAQLGLEPNTPLGQAYLIPFGKQCQLQIGYKGLIDLAYRSGEVKTIQAHTIYENDEWEYELGLDPKLKHIPAKTNRGKPIMYYAVFKLKNGGEGFQVMSKEDVLEHAQKKSKTFNNGPWQTDFDAMAKKTVIKKLLKYAPLKSDFVRAVVQDETVKSFNPYGDNEMQDVKAEVFEVEVTEHEETGEVKEG